MNLVLMIQKKYQKEQKKLLTEDKFIILKNIKKFIISLEPLLNTFPKKDYFSKDTIYKDSLDLLELIYKANYTNDLNLKKIYQIEALSKINKIDFFLERAYKLKYISEKQVLRKSEELLKINKMIYMWCKNDK